MGGKLPARLSHTADGALGGTRGAYREVLEISAAFLVYGLYRSPLVQYRN